MSAEETRRTVVRVRAWDPLVRTTHWLIALSIVLLSGTGFYIGHPFLEVRGEASQHFVMGTVKVVHFYAAIAFTVAILARLAWMALGRGHARWREFLPVTRERQVALIHAIQFYMFLRKKPDPAVGHNPAAGLAYLAVYGIGLVMAVTGLGLYANDASVTSPLRHFAFFLGLVGGAQAATWIHHVGMWLLLGFVVQHVYSAVLTSIVEGDGVLDSIFSGSKWVPAQEADEDAAAQARP